MSCKCLIISLNCKERSLAGSVIQAKTDLQQKRILRWRTSLPGNKGKKGVVDSGGAAEGESKKFQTKLDNRTYNPYTGYNRVLPSDSIRSPKTCHQTISDRAHGSRRPANSKNTL